jgi:hypothetical protein
MESDESSSEPTVQNFFGITASRDRHMSALTLSWISSVKGVETHEATSHQESSAPLIGSATSWIDGAARAHQLSQRSSLGCSKKSSKPWPGVHTHPQSTMSISFVASL